MVANFISSNNKGCGSQLPTNRDWYTHRKGHTPITGPWLDEATHIGRIVIVFLQHKYQVQYYCSYSVIPAK